MRHGLVTVGISLALATVGAVLVLNWLVNDDIAKSFLIHATAEHRQSGIGSVKVEFEENNILLNVNLTRPMSCADVIEILGVEDLPLRGKIYIPTCKTVKPESVVITYKKQELM